MLHVSRRVQPQALEMFTKLKSAAGLLTLKASDLWWSLANRNVVPRKRLTTFASIFHLLSMRGSLCSPGISLAIWTTKIFWVGGQNWGHADHTNFSQTCQ